MPRAQFSLRGFLLLLAVICFCLGAKVEAAKRRKQAIDQIVRSGGTVEFATDRPSWLWSITKNDGFAAVSEIKLRGPQFTDDFIPVLAILPEVESLELSNLSVYHVDNPYGSFPPMVEIVDNDKGVTDSGLDALRSLPALKILRLRAPLVTDEGLKSLSRCPQLSELFLDCQQISNRSLHHLLRATELTRVFLWRGHVTRAAANAFKRVKPNCRLEGAID